MSLNNSSVSRVLSASAASWMRICVNIFAQVALVPIYLSSWDIETYGVWILVQGIWVIVIILDIAHQDYVGYECLKLGENQRTQISHIISSAVPIAFLIAVWDLFLVWKIGEVHFIAHLIDVDSRLIKEAESSLLLLACTWFITGGGGLLNRWVIPLGYNAHVTWFGVLNGAMSALTPALAVFCGANLYQAVISLCSASIFFCLIYYVYMWRLIARLRLRPTRPNFRAGSKRGLMSFWLAAKSLTETVRQQGIRIVLAPLVGTVEMVAFSTMRTGSNFALQGLNTITGPIMPELLRFLASREQNRLEGAFSVVWLVLCGFVGPVVLVIQYVAPELFPLWTNNKINYDPWLFGTLSISVLVFGLAQPAVAVIVGKNSVKSQLGISVIAALLALYGSIVIAPNFGIRGVAFMMLFSEVVSLIGSVWWANELLSRDNLRWPWGAFGIVSISVISVGLMLIAQEYVPQNFLLLFLFICIILQILIAYCYWNMLPSFIRQTAFNFINEKFINKIKKLLIRNKNI